MRFFRFVLQEARTPVRKMAVMAVLAGATNGLILAIINYASEAVAYGANEPVLFIAFLAAIFIVSISHKKLIRLGSHEVEKILHHLRMDMTKRIAFCELPAVEEVGKAKFLTAMVQEIQVISRNTPQIVNACQAASLAIFGSIYLAFISFPAFLVMLVLVALGALLYKAKAEERNRLLVRAFKSEANVVHRLHDVLEGAKEIRLSPQKGHDLVEDFDQVSKRGASAKSEAMICVADDYVTGRSLFYVILAVQIFIIPMFAGRLGIDVPKSTAAVLFLLWPVNSVLLVLPVMEMVNVALENIETLRKRVKTIEANGIAAAEPGDFSTIEMRNVTFTYPRHGDAAPYSIGPINFTLKKGETVFITGGNGYGKSTLLKVFSGLYKPLSGQILVDGIPVENFANYRTLMTSVFSDYHLFKKLYGLSNYDRAAGAELMELLQLTEKVTIEQAEFSTIALSSGQRKRLGLFVAVMENKPVLILDEWAAEQDPQFRKSFYEKLLPWLKKHEQTILAVSHDDQYFGTSDRWLVMHQGQLRQDYIDD